MRPLRLQCRMQTHFDGRHRGHPAACLGTYSSSRWDGQFILIPFHCVFHTPPLYGVSATFNCVCSTFQCFGVQLMHQPFGAFSVHGAQKNVSHSAPTAHKKQHKVKAFPECPFEEVAQGWGASHRALSFTRSPIAHTALEHHGKPRRAGRMWGYGGGGGGGNRCACGGTRETRCKAHPNKFARWCAHSM